MGWNHVPLRRGLVEHMFFLIDTQFSFVFSSLGTVEVLGSCLLIAIAAASLGNQGYSGLILADIHS